MSTTQSTSVTEKQSEFIQRLIGERDCSTLEAKRLDATTKAQASDLINLLLGLPYRKSEKPSAVEEGFYVHNDTVYRAQKSKSTGNLYAKVLRITVDGKGTWEYVPGAVKKISQAEKLTVEVASRLGMHYGVCMVCGRELTNEESVSQGIGPICRNKL